METTNRTMSTNGEWRSRRDASAPSRAFRSGLSTLNSAHRDKSLVRNKYPFARLSLQPYEVSPFTTFESCGTNNRPTEALPVNQLFDFRPMRYHDFHLAGYTVSDFGGTVTLHLVYDYPGQAKEESVIQFADVVAYHFIHTGGAIITEIAEEPIAGLFQRNGRDLVEWWRLHGGYQLWDDDLDKYRGKLETAGYQAWAIYSAIGFGGFVIAKAVVQREPNKIAPPEPPPAASHSDTLDHQTLDSLPAPVFGGGR
jgi:hypothetical protein